MHQPSTHTAIQLKTITQSIHTKIVRLDEAIVKELRLRLRAHLPLIGPHPHTRIHLEHGLPRRQRLRPPNVLGPEQELPVQVRLLDQIIVGDRDQPLARRVARHSQQRVVLQHLAADGATADHEEAQLPQLVEGRLAAEAQAQVVPAVARGKASPFRGRRSSRPRFVELEAVEVEPLLYGREFVGD